MNGVKVDEGDPPGGQDRGVGPVADPYADDLALLHRVSTLPPGDSEDRLSQWLEAGAATLGASVGLVLIGTGPSSTVRAVIGNAIDGLRRESVVVDHRVLDAINRRATVAVLGGASAAGSPVPGTPTGLGAGTVVISPLWVSGEVAGAVTFVAAADHPPFVAWSLALVDLVADGVARVLEHQADSRRLVKVRSRAEAMIDLIPDPIVRLGRNGFLVSVDREPASGPFDPCGAIRVGGGPDIKTLARMKAAIARALDSGALHTAVFPAGSGPLARRVEARFVPSAGDEVLCIVRDITDRYRAEQALADQVAFEALVTSISTRLISCAPSAVDQAITAGLGEVASFFAADTAFLQELSADGTTLHLSHLWTPPGHEALRHQGQRVDASGLDWLTSRFEHHGHVYARGPLPGPPTATSARLSEPDDLAALWVRLGSAADVVGVVGLTWRSHEPPATDEVLGLVRFAADAFHRAIQRRSLAMLADGQAAVFESIARNEPVASALLGARDLLAHTTPGARVLVLTVDGDHLDLVTDDPDDPWIAWFAGLPLGLGNPYGQAVSTGEAVVVADARRDPRFGQDAVPDPAFRSVAVHPVRSSRDGRTLAVVALLGDDESALFTSALVLNSVLSLVAVALEREADTRQLAHQATHDPLTGVGNRAALRDRLTMVLARARRTGRPVAVLFCDLDGFKAVNDQYGHDRGDRLLVEVADRIRRAVRPSDTLSRTGGDEFVVVCEDLSSTDQAGLIADRVYEAIGSTPLLVGDEVLGVTVSIGVALADSVLDDPDSLLRAADLAMYENKERSRALRLASSAGSAGSSSLPSSSREPAGVEVALARAIADGDLELHHQPLVGRDGSLAGVEALLRWDHDGQGQYGPERTVAAAAKLGLAGSLGQWVRRQALAERSRWEPTGPGEAHFPVHVNVSEHELLEVGYVDALVTDLGRLGVGPDDLVLEVPEADLGQAEARGVLAELHRLAIPVVVDAVGQGGLPLAQLASLPVRGLKIGPDLVGRIEDGGAALEVVRSLVLLAHGLGWQSLAAGVETDQQRAVLFGFGVDAVQGRAVAMPSDADHLRLWLDARREADR